MVRTACWVRGDFYDVTLIETGQNAFLIGDVSGHGMAAALISAWILGYVRKSKAAYPEPPHLLGDLRLLIGELSEEMDSDAPSCTAFYGLYDPPLRVLRYCNAGHPSPLLMDRTGQTIRPLESQCMLIAAATGAQCRGTQLDVEIASGSRLLLYTDGLVEVFSAAGEQSSPRRLMEQLAAVRALPAEKAADAIIESARQFSAPAGFRDDVTLLILDFH